jgi:threonine synthase
MTLLFHSTNGTVPAVPVGYALLQGQAADKGLYMPESIPQLTDELKRKARSLTYPELATEILWPYVEGTFERADLEAICHSAYDYAIPLEHVTGKSHVMRLDQGPTASFKDFAARFMGRALGRLVAARGDHLLILTATSGDTGSAVASAFQGVDNIRVLVLFPEKEVSDRQRKQMTTLGGNIATLALPGKFDDCQALVKRAFADPDLAALNLSSANSINIGRLLPQSVYYTWSAAQLADIAGGEKVIFSVPSGNFGDMMGGMLAMHSGLPVERFVIATNANDEVPIFLETGNYEKLVPSRVCISNAMNVGHPSNLARLVALYGGQMDETGALHKPADMERMRSDLFAVSISDAETRETIQTVMQDHQTMLEPHGAVGWAGLVRYLATHPSEATAISLETAHPAKFPEEIQKLTGQEPDLPPSLQGIEDLPENYGEMAVDYDDFKAHLQKEYTA